MGHLVVVISGQYGGIDAGQAAQDPVREVKSALRDPIEISGDADLRMRVQLYVSGEITRFDEPSGWSNIRVRLAQGSVSCDLTMGTEVWSAGREATIGFVLSSLGSAVEDLVGRLRKKSFTFDAAPVRARLDEAARDLLP